MTQALAARLPATAPAGPRSRGRSYDADMDPGDQVVRHVQVDGRDLAWSAVGSGPPVVVSGWWCSHLGLNWSDPAFRRFVGVLAAHHTVIRYDRPGTGMSDRRGDVPTTVDDELALLVGLLDAAGLATVSLVGASAGCGVAMACAAAHPGRVDRLVLYGSYLRGADIAAPAARAALVDVVQQHWGLGSRVLADLFLPNATVAERDAFAAFQRSSATRDTAAASLHAAYELDLSAAAPHVTAPTLVLHRRADRAIGAALGREVARAIPGARHVELDGDDHLPWRGDWLPVADAIDAFLRGREPEARRPAPLSSGAPAAAALSAREREVLALVATGLTDAQVARRLALSPHTVHRHVSNIRTKLAVPSRSAAVAWWSREGAGSG